MTHQLPETDQTSVSREQLIAMMDVCMGGRVAEELIFGAEKVTTGASSDMEKASKIAREMVLRYGMGDSTGLVSYSDEQLKHLSSDARAIIDNEIKSIIETSYGRAKLLLTDKQNELHRLAQALLKYETLDAKEIVAVLKGSQLKKDL